MQGCYSKGSPALMSKKLVSQSGDLTKDLVFLYSTIMAVTVLVWGIPYNRRIFFIFLLCTEGKVLEKSTKHKVACRFFSLMPSIICQRVRICSTDDLFFFKAILIFFWSTFSICGCFLLRSIEIFAAMQVSDILL